MQRGGVAFEWISPAHRAGDHRLKLHIGGKYLRVSCPGGCFLAVETLSPESSAWKSPEGRACPEEEESRGYLLGYPGASRRNLHTAHQLVRRDVTLEDPGRTRPNPNTRVQVSAAKQ